LNPDMGKRFFSSAIHPSSYSVGRGVLSLG